MPFLLPSFTSLEEELERIAWIRSYHQQLLTVKEGYSCVPLFLTLNKETRIEKMIMITAVQT